MEELKKNTSIDVGVATAVSTVNMVRRKPLVEKMYRRINDNRTSMPSAVLRCSSDIS